MPILKEHKELLLTQSDSKTLPEWEEYFDGLYTRNQIYSFCYRNDCLIKKISDEERSKIQSQNARKYKINQHYFKEWNHHMAYTLGLWWADGCIYRGKMFDITLHTKDKYILNKIAEDMQYEGLTRDFVDRQACRLNFSCVTMYNDIRALGGTERKSLTAIFPEGIPDQFLSDFIRGYFDGDGSVWFVKGGRINSEFCSGSKPFLEKLLDILHEKTDVVGGSIHLCNASYYELTFGKKDSLKLAKFMYKNVKSDNDFYLLRKKQKFDIFLKEEKQL